MRNFSGEIRQITRSVFWVSRLVSQYRALLRSTFTVIALTVLACAPALASQGAVRLLYTVPNTTFIEQPSGESVVTINDTSRSISSVQSAIDSARAASPDSVIVIHLLRGAIYTVNTVGLSLGSHECLVMEGAMVRAANSSVTVPLITIAPGATNVSISGGTLDGLKARPKAFLLRQPAA